MLKMYGTWAQKLPCIPDNNGSDSWLWFQLNSEHRLTWMCLACHKPEDEAPVDGSRTTLRICNFLEHQGTAKHIGNVNQWFGLKLTTPDSVDTSAPPASLFKELLKFFQHGAVDSRGINLHSGIIGQLKAGEMRWCLREAYCDLKRAHLREAACINIFRDERHNRLHCRFRCSNAHDAHTFSAFLGQHQQFQPDAIGLTQATLEIWRNACTIRANPPKRAIVTPSVDEKLFHDGRRKIEAISVDSAENEVVSARDMATPRTGQDEVDFPNCKFVLRDAAHATRRVLSRLFTADPYLKYTMDFFMLMAMIIQWSGDMRNLYNECSVASTDSAVTTNFSHMRAAKHRIESWLTPVSRCCLAPDGPDKNT